MKKTLLLCAVGLVASSSLTSKDQGAKVDKLLSTSETSSASLQINMRVIDRDKLLAESKEGQNLIQKTQNIQQKIQKSYQKAQERVAKIEQEEARKDPMSRGEMNTKVEREARRAKFDVEETSLDYREQIKEMETSFMSKVDNSIKSTAKKNNWGLVIDVKHPAVIYASDDLDVTDDVVKNLNREFDADIAKAALLKNSDKKVDKKKEIKNV